AQNVASEWSDYDIAVLVKSNLSKQQRKQIYDKVYDLVSKKINRLVDIDIVFLPEAPMELQNHVAKYGKVLYEQNAQVFPRFRESVMRNYADFAPLRQIFQNATLARITP
ncbi:MAG: Nucleotidyltransferase, partial [Candidatus Gottesmanbacteria bacterium GW2011_GWA1_43_11]